MTTKTGRAQVVGPEVVAEIVRGYGRSPHQEAFYILMLDGRHGLMEHIEATVGTLSSCLIDGRTAFRRAIEISAAAIILAHNHPSGDPDPSPEDLAVTKKMRMAGELLGIDVLDHVVVGSEFYLSLREQAWEPIPEGLRSWEVTWGAR